MIRITVGYVLAIGVVTLLADAGRLTVYLERLHDIPFADKVVHFVLAGGLALLVNLSIRSKLGTTRWISVVPGTLAVTLVTTLEEFSNMIVPVRNWSLADLAANYLGILCVGVLPLVVSHLHGQRDCASKLGAPVAN